MTEQQITRMDAIREQAAMLSNPCFVTSEANRLKPFWKGGVTFEVADNDPKHNGVNLHAASLIVDGTHRPATEEEIAGFQTARKHRGQEILKAERLRKQQLVLADQEAMSPELEERLMAKPLARLEKGKKTQVLEN